MNETWHTTHELQMPTTLQQRVAWHEQHAKHCSCRKVLPKTIVAALKKAGKRVCSRGHIFTGSGPCTICWPGRRTTKRL